MLLDMLSDINNKTLINHSKCYSFADEKKLYEIFSFMKNNINFINSCKTTTSSETLVYGYGNNLSKNILLYSVLKLNNFDCNLTCSILKDNVNIFNNHFSKSFPWFYVKINLNNTNYYLDCTFDKDYLNSTKLVYKGDKLNYLPGNYYLNDVCSFTTLHKLENITDLSIIDYFNKNHNMCNKEFCYV